jgi:hypothetical protein
MFVKIAQPSCSRYKYMIVYACLFLHEIGAKSELQAVLSKLHSYPLYSSTDKYYTWAIS